MDKVVLLLDGFRLLEGEKNSKNTTLTVEKLRMSSSCFSCGLEMRERQSHAYG